MKMMNLLIPCLFYMITIMEILWHLLYYLLFYVLYCLSLANKFSRFVQFGADQDCHCGAVGCRRKLGVRPTKPKISSDAALKLVACQVAVSSPKLKAILSGRDVIRNGTLHVGSSKQARNQQVVHAYNCIGEVIWIARPISGRSFGIIKRFDQYSRKHSIMFEDGNVEFLDMSKEDWEFARL
ncbi:Histone-lysine N-methyltransferase ASHH3, partial [Cucurbita argyrosperma subsp. argyrosperma]